MMLKGLYSIPLSQPFLPVFAEKLLQGYAGDPLSLAACTLFLPTRRSIRALKEILLAQSPHASTFLPKMIPLGEISEEELGLSELTLIPEIPALRRQALLAKLIQAFGKEGYPLTTPQAFKLGADLMGLLDQVVLENLDFQDLKTLVREEFSQHWQMTLSFLDIVVKAWPEVLADEKGVEPAQARRKSIESLVQTWKNNPPVSPFMVVGSTGSMTLTRTLMKGVLGLSKGAVVLPGFEADYFETAVTHITHPLHTVSVTAQDCGIPVQVLQGQDSLSHASISTVLEALEPEMKKKKEYSSLPNVHPIACKNEWEEANTIALILREALEDEGKTSLLVTPDRTLARRVAALLKRWDVDVDDSSGKPLSETPIGIFTRAVLEYALDPSDAAKLLAVGKHPLFHMGYEKPILRKILETLEIHHLRVPYLHGYGRERAYEEESLGAFYKGFLDAFAPLQETFSQNGFDFKAFMQAFRGTLEVIADPENKTFQGDLIPFLTSLEENLGDLGFFKGEELPSLLTLLMSGVSIRSKRPAHPRISILGPLESRLMTADRVILAGLNEGTWPLVPETGPWLSRPMRVDFGLQPLEQRIGLSAHDFVRAFAADEVFLTRSTKVQGTPTLPCRWLLRLETLLGAAYPSPKAQDYLQWGDSFDTPGETIKLAPPKPKPPLHHRPKSLSVTQVETWMRDPYALYAREILKLKKLNPLCPEPSVADRGTLIHRCLERYKAEQKTTVQDLLTIGADVFQDPETSPLITAFWWPRYVKMAAWFVEEDKQFSQKQQSHTVTETKGAWGLGSFTLTAKADRIDMSPQKAIVIDYKTGGVPSEKAVKAGYACQLPLEGLILRHGGFGTGQASQPQSQPFGIELQYWSLSGRDKGGEIRSLKKGGDLIDAAEEGLQRLIQTFDNANIPYQSQPRPAWRLAYSDYDHLARTQEWGQG